MQCDQSPTTIAVLRESAHGHSGVAADYEPLMEVVGNARVVLFGQASYGTHEFFAARARFTRYLIEQKGFGAVAVAADWADTRRVNRYVQGDGEDCNALAALDGFRHFPTYTWRNAAVIDFLEWLRAYNQALQGAPTIGFHGLDFYNTHNAGRALIDYLEGIDPAAAGRMRLRYAFGCFGDLSDQVPDYCDQTVSSQKLSCADEIIAELVELRRKSVDEIRSAGMSAEYESFFAEHDALHACNAGRYYRRMFGGKASSWNLHNRHLDESLAALVDHLERSVSRGKVVFWAHNADVGDTRATDMQRLRDRSLGQLARERYGEDAVLIGLTTYQGTVRAAARWDGPIEQRMVLPAVPDSYESMFHDVGIPRFVLPIRSSMTVAEALRGPTLLRSIGMIYRNEAERLNHYSQTRLSDQFDAVVHFDQTTGVHPLVGDPGYEADEIPSAIPACA
jgi:erythromycin esterase-like protein